MFLKGESVAAVIPPGSNYFVTHGGRKGVISDSIIENGKYYVNFGPGLESVWLPGDHLIRTESVVEEKQLKYTIELSEREYVQLMQLTLRCGTGSIDDGFTFPPSFFLALSSAKRSQA